MKLFHKYAKAGKIAKSLWAKACKFDGHPATSKFVVFSDSNPYAEAAGRASLFYVKLLKGMFDPVNLPQ